MPKYRNKKTTIATSFPTLATRSSIINDFKPSFPPKVTIDELISKSLSNSDSKYNRTPNPFIIYRKVFNREISKLKLDLSLKEISTKASESWNHETEHVKNAYRKLAEDAKLLFKNVAPLCVVSDKHYDLNKMNKDNSSKGLRILYFDPNRVDNNDDQEKCVEKEINNYDSTSISNTNIDAMLGVNTFNFVPTPMNDTQSTPLTTNYDPSKFEYNKSPSLESELSIPLTPENGNYSNSYYQSLWNSPTDLYRHPLVKQLLARIQYLEYLLINKIYE
ncbi:12477_t:CDS:1 [Cetraspora pellucida]|uniref:12477_t:CDS:1 n=1 Tax=Cetraspora pellucida TaxID=1433469 RepID=A0A9N9C474_9GLOM|nr:12477_t:CDS:1 [Cetraspora pellucida]